MDHPGPTNYRKPNLQTVCLSKDVEATEAKHKALQTIGDDEELNRWVEERRELVKDSKQVWITSQMWLRPWLTSRFWAIDC